MSASAQKGSNLLAPTKTIFQEFVLRLDEGFLAFQGSHEKQTPNTENATTTRDGVIGGSAQGLGCRQRALKEGTKVHHYLAM